jgi:hypothetical protein
LAECSKITGFGGRKHPLTNFPSQSIRDLLRDGWQVGEDMFFGAPMQTATRPGADKHEPPCWRKHHAAGQRRNRFVWHLPFFKKKASHVETMRTDGRSQPPPDALRQNPNGGTRKVRVRRQSEGHGKAQLRARAQPRVKPGDGEDLQLAGRQSATGGKRGPFLSRLQDSVGLGTLDFEFLGAAEAELHGRPLNHDSDPPKLAFRLPSKGKQTEVQSAGGGDFNGAGSHKSSRVP